MEIEGTVKLSKTNYCTDTTDRLLKEISLYLQGGRVGLTPCASEKQHAPKLCTANS